MIKAPQMPALQVVMKEARRAVKPLVLFSAGMNVLMLTGAFYMLQVYHRVLPSQSVPTLVGITIVVVFLYAIYGLLDFVRLRLLVRTGVADNVGGALLPRLWRCGS